MTWYDQFSMQGIQNSYPSLEPTLYPSYHTRGGIPVPVYAFARGGSIIVHKEKVRQSALLARNDTGFNLTVYLNKLPDSEGRRRASGFLYLDDGETYNYQRMNEYQMIHFEFDAETGILTGRKLNHEKNGVGPYLFPHDFLTSIELVGAQASYSEAEISTSFLQDG